MTAPTPGSWRRSAPPAVTQNSMTAEQPPLDVDRLLATLERHSVDFLLVGGVAAIAHGARRPTADLDCLLVAAPETWPAWRTPCAS